MVAVALVATTVTDGCARAVEAKPVVAARMAIRKKKLTPIKFFMPPGYALSHFPDVGGPPIKLSVFVRQATGPAPRFRETAGLSPSAGDSQKRGNLTTPSLPPTKLRQRNRDKETNGPTRTPAGG